MKIKVKVLIIGYLLTFNINSSYATQMKNSDFTFLKQDFCIKIENSNQEKSEKIQTLCQEELKRIELKYSTLLQGSLVNEINQFAGRNPIKVDEEMIYLLDWSTKLAGQSQGSFDITTASFLWKYGFGQQDYRVPTYLHLDQVKPLVNYKLIIQDKSEKAVLFKKAGVQINIDQLLVSYAFGKIIKLLKKNKIKQASCTIGQNFLALGEKTGAQKWQHQIMSTWRPKQLVKTLSILQGQILVHEIFTKSFVKDNKLYHDAIDPKTGWPYQFSKMAIVFRPDLKPVSIPPAVLLTRKPDEAIAMIDKEKKSACLIVDKDNQIHYSKQWSKWIKD